MRVAAAAVLVSEGRVLLGKRSDDEDLYPGVWDLIGGHCQPGEPPSSALVREVSEELGVVPTSFEELGILSEPDPETYGPAEYHVFVVRNWHGGNPRMIGSEHSALRWVNLLECDDLPLAHPAYIGLFETVLGGDQDESNDA